MQQQHLMQMNQNMIGGYTSPAAVTTDLIQQVLILTQIPPPPFYPRVFGSFLLCLCRDLAFAVAFGFCFFSPFLFARQSIRYESKFSLFSFFSPP
jgi:hypothetical protein